MTFNYRVDNLLAMYHVILKIDVTQRFTVILAFYGPGYYYREGGKVSKGDLIRLICIKQA